MMGDENEAPKQASSGLFGGTGGFKLGSTFKGDGSAKDDLPRPPPNAGSSFFGGGSGGNAFGNALGEVTKKEGGAAGPVTPIKKEPGEEEVTRRTRARNG